jgi:hypothetical protein
LTRLHLGDEVVSGNTAEVAIDHLPEPNRFDAKVIHVKMARIPNTRSWRIIEIPEINQFMAKMLQQFMN